MADAKKVLTITPDEERKIKATYERNEEELAKDVKILKEWLKKQPHLPQDEEEQRLKTLLIRNNCSLEKAKKQLDIYYSIKHLAPEFYDFRHPLHPVMSLQMDNITLTLLPKLTPDCDRVYLFDFTSVNAKKFVINDVLKLFFSYQDLTMMYDSALGEHYIADFKHGKLGHFVQFTPAFIKKLYMVLEKAYSDKVKGIHFINLPPEADTAVTIITAVFSERIANRVIVHKDYKSLQNFIPKEILPMEYGGTAGTVDEISGNWRKYVDSKNDWIKELCEKKSDESKRVGEPINSEMFGQCGSFRKLISN